MIARIFFLLFVTWGLAACSTQGTVSFNNLSSQKIARASISICGERFELENIEAGQKTVFKHRIMFDSHFVVKVSFASGKTLSADGGYVTNGINFEHEIVVSDDVLEIILLKAS